MKVSGPPRARRADAPRARGVFGQVALLIVAATLAVSAAQRPPSRDDVLERVAAYARQFGEDLQGIVARERYVQSIRSTKGRDRLDPDTLDGDVLEERRLVSSLLLVHEAETPWQLHRDVITVDDTPVSDRDDRLAQLFAGPQADRAAQLRHITDESARYNLGRFIRNINIPTFPLIVVHPSRRDRFRFRDRGRTNIDGATVRTLAFEERSRPRIIRGTAGYDVVLKGTLDVDEGSGELVHATIEPKIHQLRVRLDVQFGRVAGVLLRVPVRLVERYSRPGEDSYVAGEATYDDYRRYTTEVGAPVPR